jgi:hypothetical protein
LAFAAFVRSLTGGILLGSGLAARVAVAQEPPPAKPETAETVTLEARRHFKAGTKLYRDGNYGGALAEFEEAYRLKPGAGSLQNVALSQKGLFRYAEAAATLELLLARHASELSDGERDALGAALTELKGLVASIVLKVSPESARVLLDGRQLGPADWSSAPLALNVGEHTLSVEAPGYAPERRVLRIAGGQRELPVSIELRCSSGFVDVTSNDPTAFVAIDGVPKARRAYRGPVEPDTDHLLQVYREGVETFEQTFRVGVCKTLGIRAKLEGLDAAPPADAVDEEAPLPGAPPTRAKRGFFGLLSLDLLALSKQPLSNVSTPSSGGGLGALGLRAGYRISGPVALDLRLDAGALQAKGALEAATGKQRDYSLTSIHFGPDLKLMTTGDKLRFVATVGTGVVHHRLAVSREIADEVRGIDPYFSLELGLGFNYRQFLGEIGLVALIDGSTSLQKGFSDPNQNLTKDLGTTLPMLGLGLRGGFSQWRSR